MLTAALNALVAHCAKGGCFHCVTFTASFDAKGLAATGSGLQIGSAWVMDWLQGPDVRWITLLDTPQIGSEMQQRWMVMAHDHCHGMLIFTYYYLYFAYYVIRSQYLVCT
jgi:hypothetical protein